MQSNREDTKAKLSSECPAKLETFLTNTNYSTEVLPGVYFSILDRSIRLINAIFAKTWPIDIVTSFTRACIWRHLWYWLWSSDWFMVLPIRKQTTFLCTTSRSLLRAYFRLKTPVWNPWKSTLRNSNWFRKVKILHFFTFLLFFLFRLLVLFSFFIDTKI